MSVMDKETEEIKNDTSNNIENKLNKNLNLSLKENW